ncbi:MAG TPA: Gfo/Idh/MocA family oxidoreductase [Acidobacteriaceae bacterium]|nr:Gfo/Idh/MocA family oxidoreductase [Acidobacteriaceae bacterium]
MNDKNRISRRDLVSGALAAGCISLLPSRVLGRAGSVPPSDKANIAFIGIGNYGGAALRELASQNIVALCDVDWRLPSQIPGRPLPGMAAEVAQRYPQARRFDDWRVMLAEMDKSIDALVVSTADHTHAVAALTAMKMGKHVFCEKPLAHSVEEVRAMMRSARKHPKQATQTGIQGHASEDVRSIVEWVQDGAIGTVQEIQVFQDGPRNLRGRNPQAPPRPSPYAQIEHIHDDIPVPPEVKWDLWLGPAPYRNYNPMYLPLRWRNWLDFGTGILGDHGPHFIDPVLWALDLGFPESIEAETDAEYDPHSNTQTFPRRSLVRYRFPARGRWPALPVTWYGNDAPPVPKGWSPEVEFPNGGGVILGSKGSIVYGPVYNSKPGSLTQVWLLPEELNQSYKRPEKRLLRPVNHWMEWIEAAKAGGQSSANWQYGGLLTQICLLGDIAIRNKGELLKFDAKKEKFTNSQSANALFQSASRPGWELPA